MYHSGNRRLCEDTWHFMKILFVVQRLTIGGCQVNAVNLGAALVQRGHQVIVAAGPGPLVGRVQAKGMSYVPVAYDGFRHPSIRFMKELAHTVLAQPVDVVQAFDPILVLESYGSQLWHHVPVFGMITAQAVPEFRLPTTRTLALVNSDTRERYIERWRLRPDRLKMVVARLNCDEYRPTAADVATVFAGLLLDPAQPIVTLVTRIDEGKWATVNLFLRAAAHWQRTRASRLPVQFVLVGGGAPLPEVQDFLKHAPGLVRITGERLDIPAVMNSSSVVLGMASTCQQGLACGRPVVALGNLGYSALIQPNNFETLAARHFNIHDLADLDQPETLSQQLETVLLDPRRAEQLGNFGRQMACERYDSRIGAQQLESEYLNLLNAPPQNRSKRMRAWLDVQVALLSLYWWNTRRRLVRRMTEFWR